MYFITILSWFGFIIYGIITVATISSFNDYNYTKRGDLEKLLDNMKGYEKKFDVRTPALKTIICLSWLIFYYFS